MKQKNRTYRVVLTDENELPLLKMKNKNGWINIKFDIAIGETQYIFDVDCNIYRNKFTCTLNNKEFIGEEAPDRFSFFVSSRLEKNYYIVKLSRSNDLEYDEGIVCVNIESEQNNYEWLSNKDPVEKTEMDCVRIIPFTNKL
jgi:hypothetical protein